MQYEPLAFVLRRSFLSAQSSSTTSSLLLFFSPPATPFDRVIFIVHILQASLSAHLLQWSGLRPTPVVDDCRGLFPPALEARLYLTQDQQLGTGRRFAPSRISLHVIIPFILVAHPSLCSSYNSDRDSLPQLASQRPAKTSCTHQVSHWIGVN